MTNRNFLLARGERLATGVEIKMGGQPKQPPYSFAEARARLQPMLTILAQSLDTLPDAACPNDSAIATVTLNPEYIAKSYFPNELLNSVGLTSVGSRSKRVKPQKRSGGREVAETVSTELFLRGTRSAYRNWSRQLGQWQSSRTGANQLTTIEAVTAPDPGDKLIHINAGGTETEVFEVVLHTGKDEGEHVFIPKFRDYLRSLGLDPGLEKKFYAGGLCFVELEAPADRIEDVAAFSLVRAIRPMPALRMLRPAFRTVGVGNDLAILPKEAPVDPKLRAAIFDGGIPAGHPLLKWAKRIDAPGIGPATDELLQHGVGVTSAFLFGHLAANKPAPRPFGPVDHYRVIDTEPGQNPYELYEVLGRIQQILTTAPAYSFVNLSLGPELPIDDDEVHAWTAVLDDQFSHGQTLAVVAVGNGGEGDVAINANRVQVPSDCVNALAIGAADTPDKEWARASYSSVGPGRSPGLIKPDLVAFGGSMARPFLVLSHDGAPKLEPTGGTSFAAPSALRLGAGVRAHFGDVLSPLAIRALLVHCAEAADIPHTEIGWGRVATHLEEIVVCGDDTVRVVYQGEVNAAKYIRAPVPVPDIPFKGMVTVKATLCYATKVDPHHPGNYTRAGLDVFFRPNKDAFKDEDAQHAATKGFFGKSRPRLTEEELRRDAWKWENCQHAAHSFRGRSLNSPVFDIHYNARAEGHNDGRSQKLNYALIVSVTAKRVPDLYNRIVTRYRAQLEALQPVIDIPVRVDAEDPDASE